MKSTHPTSIAIVGGGASGALTAMQIAKQATLPCRVILFDPTGQPGLGLAYGTRCLSHLMNVPAAKLSANPDEPEDFLKWLNDPGNCAELVTGKTVQPGDFVPRALYGRYLHRALREAFDNPSCVARLEIRSVKAVDFIPYGVGGTLVAADAETEDIRHVVLALGNLPPRDPLPGYHPFFKSPRYITNVWKEDVLSEVKSEEDVLIVGTGLTAIDTVLALEDLGHAGRYILTSRGGKLPQPHAPANPPEDFLKGKVHPETIREWVRLVREEVARQDERGGDWRPVIDALRPYTQGIWMKLPEGERKRFLRHVRTFWESHRHRCPPASWKRISALREKGRLELVPGRLRSLEDNGDAVDIGLQVKGSSAVRLIRAGRVINCIGPESNFRQHFNDKLIINLMARGSIHPDSLCLGLDATPEGKLLTLAGKPNEYLSLLGPPLKGCLWESTAIPEIRVQAKMVAKRVLAQLAATDWAI